MIALQEELDWHCYWSYGLTDDSLEHPHPPEISSGQRAFGIVFARRMARGEAHTTWFEWVNITPSTELPSHWPADYRALVEKRITLIQSDRNIALIETIKHPEQQALLTLHREALQQRLSAAIS